MYIIFNYSGSARYLKDILSHGKDIVYSLQKYKVLRKIDLGAVLLLVKDDDKKGLEKILETGAFETPQLKLSIYKNRRGQYKGIYLWCKADLGTCRIKPMFATGWDYELIPIDDTRIHVASAFPDDEDD